MVLVVVLREVLRELMVVVEEEKYVEDGVQFQIRGVILVKWSDQ